MKTINFKNSVIALAIGMATVSCGGGNSSKNNASGKKTDVEAAKELVAKADDKGVTDDNWQAFIKKNYGVDAAVPAGWKFLQVRAYGFSTDNESIIVAFETTGDNATKVADAAKALFDKPKAFSSGGNFSMDVDNNSTVPKKGKTYATFDEVFKPNALYDGVTAINQEFWYYTGANGTLQSVTVNANKGRMTFKFEKMPIKL
jgi:hypothetical protein